MSSNQCVLSVMGCQGSLKPGLRSPLSWAGGKSKLVKTLKKRIPPHRVYVEPFAGAAWLFFAKEPAKVNVINDVDGRLMDFYRYLQTTKNFSCNMMPSMDRWHRLRKKYERDVKLKPCDWLYAIKYSYGSKSRRLSPNPSQVKNCMKLDNPRDCTIIHVKRNFEAYQDLLRKTTILNKDYRSVIKKYDSKDTFFYIDPPFHEIKCPYLSCDVDPVQLASAVKRLKGKFLLSYNNHPDVRRAFKGYKIEKVSTKYELQRALTGTEKKVKELLIRNY